MAVDKLITDTVLANTLDSKQDKLVSGTNIKTINGNSVLGSGNITIEGGTTYTAGTNISISDGKISADNFSAETTFNSYDMTSQTGEETENITLGYYISRPYFVNISSSNNSAILFMMPSNYYVDNFKKVIINAAYTLTSQNVDYHTAVSLIITYWANLSTEQQRALMFQLFTNFIRLGCNIYFYDDTAGFYNIVQIDTISQGVWIIKQTTTGLERNDMISKFLENGALSSITINYAN